MKKIMCLGLFIAFTIACVTTAITSSSSPPVNSDQAQVVSNIPNTAQILLNTASVTLVTPPAMDGCVIEELVCINTNTSANPGNIAQSQNNMTKCESGILCLNSNEGSINLTGCCMTGYVVMKTITKDNTGAIFWKDAGTIQTNQT